MEINQNYANEAIALALSRYPEFAQYGPRIAYRTLFQGGAWIVSYDQEPPKDFPNTWAFLETAVKAYRSRAGV